MVDTAEAGVAGPPPSRRGAGAYPPSSLLELRLWLALGGGWREVESSEGSASSSSPAPALGPCRDIDAAVESCVDGVSERGMCDMDSKSGLGGSDASEEGAVLVWMGSSWGLYSSR